jgi:glycine/D-amino acid oxidase-like deaminating enzyme
VLEAHSVGFGASGRNGGHLNNGLAHSYLSAQAAFGPDKARALYRAFDDGIDTIERIVAEEGIACDFRRSGKLKLASKPQHLDAIARNCAAIRAGADPEVEMLSREDLRAELGSQAFHGGMLQKKSAMMHMGRFVTGLAGAAVRRGAVIYEAAPVTARQPQGRGWRLETPRGAVTADKVFLATGAYTGGAFGWFRRRIVPVGSFLLATRPLSAQEVAATLPGNRACVTSLNIGNYFRLAPDNRLIFGGRARFSARSDQRSDARSGEILRRAMAGIFPHLADVPLDYCWGGLVDMTQDRYPRAGEADGVSYAMGYSGHGAQLATHMGEMMAERLLLGLPVANPFADLPWAPVPLHTGKPWFLPLVGLYFKTLDMVK